MDAWTDWLSQGGVWIAASGLLAAVLVGGSRIGAKLNIKQKGKRLDKQLRKVCPHTDYLPDRGALRSTFIEIRETTAYRCVVCGTVIYSQAQIEASLKHWADHPREFVRRLRQCEKLFEKFAP